MDDKISRKNSYLRTNIVQHPAKHKHYTLISGILQVSEISGILQVSEVGDTFPF